MRLRLPRSSRAAHRVPALVERVESRVLMHGGADATGGLVGAYFDNTDFTSPVLTRTDRTVDFYWHDASPAPAVGADTFSARWTGQLLPHETATYTFTARADDGIRLSVNGQVVIDQLARTATGMTDHTGTAPLVAGQAADILVEYVERGGLSGARLYWQTPTSAKAVIPADHLTPGTATPPDAPPAQPDGLEGVAPSASQIRIGWTDGSANETAFEVQRSPGLEGFSTIGTVPADQVEFLDSGLSGGVRYFYRVRATSAIGDSRWSPITNTFADGAEQPILPPTAPTGVTATATETAIAVAWTDTSANETAFVLQRRVGTTGEFADLTTLGAGSTTYTDAAVSPGVAYAYRVRATNLAGASAPSAEASATVPTVDPPPGDTDFTEITWTTRASGPIPRSEAMAAVIGGKLYQFGGFSYASGSFDGPVDRVDVYDPAANTWTRLADMPTRLTHAGEAVDGQYVYIAGGYVGIEATGTRQQFGTTDVWRYDSETDTYTAMPPLPNRRGSGALVVLGRELHFFGGNNASREDVGTHYILDLDGGTAWTESAPLPNPRSHMGFAAFDGRIYAIAGQTGNDELLVTHGDVHVWDPADPTQWTTRAPMPQPVSHISSSTFVLGNRIIVLGGETDHAVGIRTNWAYDPADDTWTELTSLPAARYSGVAGEIDGTLYYATGSKTTTTYRGRPVLP